MKYEKIFYASKSPLFFFCKPLKLTNRAQDYLGHYPVQYLENIGPTTDEQSDWLILVIGPLAT